MACRNALDNLRGVGIIVKDVVHNDNRCMDSILDDIGILNQKYLWHKAKNMVKKFVLMLVSVSFTITMDIANVISSSELQARCWWIVESEERESPL